MLSLLRTLSSLCDTLVSLFPLILVLSIALLAYIMLQQRTGFSRQLRYGRSDNDAPGIIFGRLWGLRVYSPADAEGHIFVVGGTGLGKTSALLIPTLQQWPGASFTIDISGDICKNVTSPRKLVYEPLNRNSTPYNILGHIDAAKSREEQDELLAQLALLLMPDLSRRDSDAADFFNREGRKILTGALIAYYHQGLDFSAICTKIISLSYPELFNEIDHTQDKQAQFYINSFFGTSEQNTAGCKQACDQAITLFATNPTLQATIRRPMGNEPSYTAAEISAHSVFIVIPDEKLKLLSPLLHIIVAQALEYFSSRPLTEKKTILFCLDEFASFGRLEITDALRKLRKRHIRIMSLTQSLADVDLVYGIDERRAMMTNFRFKVLLGADDSDTQDYFARLLGKKEVTHKSFTTGARSSQTSTTTKEWAIEPAELAHLGNHLILLHPDGFLKLKKNFFFK